MTLESLKVLIGGTESAQLVKDTTGDFDVLLCNVGCGTTNAEEQQQRMDEIKEVLEEKWGDVPFERTRPKHGIAVFWRASKFENNELNFPGRKQSLGLYAERDSRSSVIYASKPNDFQLGAVIKLKLKESRLQFLAASLFGSSTSPYDGMLQIAWLRNLCVSNGCPAVGIVGDRDRDLRTFINNQEEWCGEHKLSNTEAESAVFSIIPKLMVMDNIVVKRPSRQQVFGDDGHNQVTISCSPVQTSVKRSDVGTCTYGDGEGKGLKVLCWNVDQTSPRSAGEEACKAKIPLIQTVIHKEDPDVLLLQECPYSLVQERLGNAAYNWERKIINNKSLLIAAKQDLTLKTVTDQELRDVVLSKDRFFRTTTQEAARGFDVKNHVWKQRDLWLREFEEALNRILLARITQESTGTSFYLCSVHLPTQNKEVKGVKVFGQPFKITTADVWFEALHSAQAYANYMGSSLIVAGDFNCGSVGHETRSFAEKFPEMEVVSANCKDPLRSAIDHVIRVDPVLCCPCNVISTEKSSVDVVNLHRLNLLERLPVASCVAVPAAIADPNQNTYWDEGTCETLSQKTTDWLRKEWQKQMLIFDHMPIIFNLKHECGTGHGDPEEFKALRK